VSDWKIARGQQAKKKIKDVTKSFNEGFGSFRKTPSIDSATIERLVRSEAFVNFKDQLDEVASSSDPLSRLESFSEDANGIQYYVFKPDGRADYNWEAYLAVKGTKGMVLLVIGEEHRTREEILTELHSTLTEFLEFLKNEQN
jgi:hypothetical protein